MSQRQSRRPSRSVESSEVGYAEGRAQRTSYGGSSYGRNQTRGGGDRPVYTPLTKLIEQDAPLHPRSQLVLMYGFFQSEMPGDDNRGVASWLKECLTKHGTPSLVRFDDRRRAQVFRRDQFQPWFDGLIES
jgi:hypothetical protein